MRSAHPVYLWRALPPPCPALSPLRTGSECREPRCLGVRSCPWAAAPAGPGRAHSSSGPSAYRDRTASVPHREKNKRSACGGPWTLSLPGDTESLTLLSVQKNPPHPTNLIFLKSLQLCALLRLSKTSSMRPAWLHHHKRYPIFFLSYIQARLVTLSSIHSYIIISQKRNEEIRLTCLSTNDENYKTAHSLIRIIHINLMFLCIVWSGHAV